MQEGEENGGPTPRRSGRQRRPNINCQGALTITEAAVVCLQMNGMGIDDSSLSMQILVMLTSSPTLISASEHPGENETHPSGPEPGNQAEQGHRSSRGNESYSSARPESGNQVEEGRGSPPAEHTMGHLGPSSMSASSLFANLFTDGGDDLERLGPPEGEPQNPD